jgi:hypothetical protein
MTAAATSVRYKEIDTGKCTDEAGWQYINDLSTCETAAWELGHDQYSSIILSQTHLQIQGCTWTPSQHDDSYKVEFNFITDQTADCSGKTLCMCVFPDPPADSVDTVVVPSTCERGVPDGDSCRIPLSIANETELMEAYKDLGCPSSDATCVGVCYLHNATGKDLLDAFTSLKC